LSIVVAAACAMIVLAASLVWLNREEALAPGTVYEPPHMQDGQVISGRGVPR
jgi:F420-dependent methylenetetrahydromethanopterin dehydrogenase